MPWYVKLETGVVNKTNFDRFVPAHKAYVQALIDRGHDATTGYWRDAPIEQRGGMLLFWANSRAEAEAIVADDPLIANGCVSHQLFEWCVVVGRPESRQESPTRDHHPSAD